MAGGLQSRCYSQIVRKWFYWEPERRGTWRPWPIVLATNSFHELVTTNVDAHIDASFGEHVLPGTLFDQLKTTKLLIADLESDLEWFAWLPDTLYTTAITERSKILGAFRARLRSLRGAIQRILLVWRSLDGPRDVVAAEIPWFLIHGCHPPEHALAFNLRMLNRRMCAA